MKKIKFFQSWPSRLIFITFFSTGIILGAFSGLNSRVEAAPAQGLDNQETAYAGPESCKECHEGIYYAWVSTRHAKAFSAPIFQKDWNDLGAKTTCLQCHTTGFNLDTGSYAHEGVTCESCHGAFQPNHPTTLMPISPDADLCATCHKSTTDEWRASVHREEGVRCQSCHNPHSQTPKADTVTALCANCHKEPGESFTHGTHADSGLECSNCHMYTRPQTEDPIEGLIPTGHTFFVGSEACIGCHQDTVHSRDKIIELTGEINHISQDTEIDPEQLQVEITSLENEISVLQNNSSVRLYTGLAQGAIVGLATGSVAAWIVSRRIKFVQEEVDDE